MILPSLRGVMGDWVFYSTLMSAKQIYDWIKPAKDIREAKALDELLQRDLKDRKKAIANYLQRNGSRFFNSIIVGVFDGVPEWAEFSISKTTQLNGYRIDSDSFKDSVGIMVFNGNEQMFAIDGQHRVAGIQIAVEADLQKERDKQVLNDDQFSVIFVAHIDNELGKKRTRRLFSDINKYARPVAEGDKIKIDEEDINAVVTRRIYAHYSYFKNGKLISLTETNKLDNSDTTYFTNLLALHKVNKKLKPLFKKKPKSVDVDEENIVQFLKIVEGFYNFMIENVRELNDYFVKQNLSLKNARKDNSYLLFRPVGLVLLAKLYTFFKKADKLEKLKENINNIGFIMPDSPYNKVLWDRGKMEAKETSQVIAYNLTLYLLKELPESETNILKKKYKEITKDDDAELPTQIVTN